MSREMVKVDKQALLQVLVKIRRATAEVELKGPGEALHPLYKAQSFLHDAFPHRWLPDLEYVNSLELSQED